MAKAHWMETDPCGCGHGLGVHDVLDSDDGNPYGVTVPCKLCQCADWANDSKPEPPRVPDELAARRALQREVERMTEHKGGRLPPQEDEYEIRAVSLPLYVVRDWDEGYPEDAQTGDLLLTPDGLEVMLTGGWAPAQVYDPIRSRTQHETQTLTSDEANEREGPKP